MVFAVTSELALTSKKDSDIVTCYLNNNHPFLSLRFTINKIEIL